MLNDFVKKRNEMRHVLMNPEESKKAKRWNKIPQADNCISPSSKFARKHILCICTMYSICLLNPVLVHSVYSLGIILKLLSKSQKCSIYFLQCHWNSVLGMLVMKITLWLYHCLYHWFLYLSDTWSKSFVTASTRGWLSTVWGDSW